jgi:hypothetical protein
MLEIGIGNDAYHIRELDHDLHIQHDRDLQDRNNDAR